MLLSTTRNEAHINPGKGRAIHMLHIDEVFELLTAANTNTIIRYTNFVKLVMFMLF